MKQFFLGLFAGCVAAAGVMWFSLTSIQDEHAKKTLDAEKENQQLQQQIATLSMKVKANVGEQEGLQKELEETEKHLHQYQRFVSQVLNGDDEDFPFEIIADDEEKTVVYSPVYREEVPRNTDLQKLYILRILNQLPEVKGRTVTLWSSKENAQLFAADTYPKDGTEGWSGMNAKFATMQREKDGIYILHHLGVHEVDQVGFGKYARKEGN